MGVGGQWAAGEGVVDGAHGFRVVKKTKCAHFFIGDPETHYLCFRKKI
jgi:hypothetical protein